MPRIFNALVITAMNLSALSAAEKTPQVEAEKVQWGSVTGRVVYSGELDDPVLDLFPKELPIYERRSMRQAKLGIGGRVVGTEINRTLLIDKKTDGIRNAFVYLKRAPYAIHPDLQKQKQDPVKIVFRKTRFIPRSLFVQKGQTIQFANYTSSEAAGFHFTPIRNMPLNFMVSPSKLREWTPQRAERFPMRIINDFSPIARSSLLILDHPYAAVTATDGSFTLKNLPVGKHQLTVWHETVGYIAKRIEVEVLPETVQEIPDTRLTAEKLQNKQGINGIGIPILQGKP